MKVITDGKSWRTALADFPHYDFYHTYDYHLLEASKDGSSPHLFVYNSSTCNVALPLLLRDIELENSMLKDARSVYGYAGPLFAGDQESSQGFCEQLTSTLTGIGIVSVFSRLHPVLDNSKLISGLGNITSAGSTVSIDLTSSPRSQWSAYRPNLRREITALQRSDVECIKSNEKDDLLDFTALYNETMIRREASPEYLISDEYVGRLCQADDFDMHLFVCRKQGNNICAGLFSTCGDIVQYHLSGTHESYYQIAPTKLMLDTVRVWANDQPMAIFHLGGGVGGAHDSLFNFKKGFSKHIHDFQVWKWILDDSAYRDLCTEFERRLKRTSEFCLNKDFFPYYRAPVSKGPPLNRSAAH